MTDPLWEVLRSVRLTGGIFLDARFTAPWCVHTKLIAEDCGAFSVKPPLLIAYHFVIEGKFLLSIEGESTVERGPARSCSCQGMTFTRWPVRPVLC